MLLEVQRKNSYGREKSKVEIQSMFSGEKLSEIKSVVARLNKLRVITRLMNSKNAV